MQTFFDRLNDLDDGASSIFLTAAYQAEAKLTLTFGLAGETYSGEEVAESWGILATAVTENRLSLGECSRWPELAPEYPRLRVAQLPTQQLMFASAPDDIEAFLGDLRSVHDETQWDTFGTYGLGQQLELGYGVFAEGPEPMLELYFPVLQAHGMRPSWLVGRPPQMPLPQACLSLGGTVWEDDLYVLAESFSAARLE